ncbi:zinc metalloproteinase nas-15-like [Rhopilema esculentum]|uniref:zinc metalloproteinase nas-15-like n=1 Tax=Rhopilema esculentum TaxID=499914 RepID=UPI0031DB4FF9
MRSIAVILLCWLYDIAISKSAEALLSDQWKTSVSSSIKPSDCKDKISKSLCIKYDKYCDISDSLKELCPRTCGLCKEVSPLLCNEMPFGCCWDGATYATGPNQKGCPACKDRSIKCAKHATKKNCDTYNTIRTQCASSCGLCGGCQDDPEQRDFCPTFKKSGFCETMKGNMERLCKKTCNLCDES